ncbi:hypothetical protein, partial [Flavobacterium croceum]|uniref:hypothetical protein n=1 Tax=Flavobacterium croceum TaxID=370975 RepID=UPI001B80797D
KWTFRQVLKFKWLFKLKCLTSEFRRKYGTQRFQALRLLRNFKTGVNKYNENFERKNMIRRKKNKRPSIQKSPSLAIA